ncbi:transcriptional repressor [Cellulosimicrobium cellulans]|uniref:Fur family transcriptional regulator n=1 Tax=Cellulosimicrobium cellulans TaxID=1710 RepID=UPI001ED9DECF|nr:transcriptional repressor [Cellulosimicrobium cellulans]UKJ63327.1 transcriptional repressor [Cellulosimicrobium cellulans]
MTEHPASDPVPSSPPGTQRVPDEPSPSDVGGRRLASQGLLVEELARSDRFRSVRDVHGSLAESGARVSLTTVYRVLGDLVRSGAAESVVLPEGGLGFRAVAGSAARLYLLCVRCGRAAPVSRDVVDRWALGVAGRHGYADVEVRVTLRGLCAACQSEALMPGS